MPLFICDDCGSKDNTALGWYHVRYLHRLNTPETLGKKLCSACAPTEYPNGEKTRFTGKWHDVFPREYAVVSEEGELNKDEN